MFSSLGQALIMIINTLGSLFILAVLLRFLLQASRADFYNPVSQALFKITAPLLNPLRRIIPGYNNIDFASLALALIINTLAAVAMILAAGYNLPNILSIISWAFIGIVSFMLNIYFYGLIISIVASWIAPFSGNPALLLIQQLMEPAQSRIRRIIPAMGGLDFSPIFLFLAIRIIEDVFIRNLANSLLLPPNYIIGI